jgi:hypothetical protein
METIKNVLGYGTAPQEGREPVSGVTGSGVAGEPYDQGNAEGMSHPVVRHEECSNKR